MAEEEVDIDSEDEGGYEGASPSPIRRLEKRIDRLEERKERDTTKDIVREMLDLVEENQKIVDEVVKSNRDLREELQKIPDKVDDVLSQWEEFLEILKEGAGSVPGEGTSGDVAEKLDRLIEQNSELVEKNEEVIDSIKSLKGLTRRGYSRSSGRPRVRIKRERD